MPTNGFPILDPALQISFHHRLQAVRETYLQQALSKTVGDVEIGDLDLQLKEFVPTACLRRVAQFGLRGEVLFAVPLLLTANPFLLGYYRLLYGFSQKEYYGKGVVFHAK
jgi:hypothetical protein